MPDNRLRENSIKNCPYFYYDNIISINDFNPKNKHR